MIGGINGQAGRRTISASGRCRHRSRPFSDGCVGTGVGVTVEDAAEPCLCGGYVEEGGGFGDLGVAVAEGGEDVGVL